MEEQIKKSQVDEDLTNAKNKKDLNNDMAQYFTERDKTNRGGDGKIADVVKMSEAEAETKQMLYEVSMQEHDFPKDVEPMFNSIFLTARRNRVRTESGVLLAASMLDASLEVEFQAQQKVVAHGPNVSQAFTGSEVVINFEAFRRHLGDNMAQKVNQESKIIIPTVMIDGVEYLKMTERELEYIAKKVERF